eukprot:9181824-Alexandrium_andersonii.AAC.1
MCSSRKVLLTLPRKAKAGSEKVLTFLPGCMPVSMKCGHPDRWDLSWDVPIPNINSTARPKRNNL